MSHIPVPTPGMAQTGALPTAVFRREWFRTSAPSKVEDVGAYHTSCVSHGGFKMALIYSKLMAAITGCRNPSKLSISASSGEHSKHQESGRMAFRWHGAMALSN